MEGVRAFGRLALVLGAATQCVVDADLLGDEHLVHQVDLSLGLGGQPALARVDPARLQRATQGPGQSTGSRRDDVVEGRGVLGVLAGRGAVVLAHRAVRAERDWFAFDREERLADRAALADDPDPTYVRRLR